jgi:RNA polymerase sigma-70 factor (ECF subfamily)
MTDAFNVSRSTWSASIEKHERRHPVCCNRRKAGLSYLSDRVISAPASSTPEPDDAVWISEVRAGSETAASRLVERLYPLVIKIVRSHLARQVAEEDLVQMVFARVFDKLDQYRGDAPLEHWVSRVAVSTCLNQLKRERVRPELRWADLSPEEVQVLDNLAATAAEIDHGTACAARELVEKLLAGLPSQDRFLLQWLHLEEKSLAQISKMTGWSVVAIKVRAFRARQKLKHRLGDLVARKEI